MFTTLGRLFLSAIFISGGANVFMNPDGRAQKVAAAGIPAPRSATILNGAVMAVAGTTLAAGIAPKLSALALLGTLIPTTFVGHPYWQETDQMTRANQQIHFLKNAGMMGGLLMVLAQKKD